MVLVCGPCGDLHPTSCAFRFTASISVFGAAAYFNCSASAAEEGLVDSVPGELRSHLLIAVKENAAREGYSRAAFMFQV
jgi:hypothetical protein